MDDSEGPLDKLMQYIPVQYNGLSGATCYLNSVLQVLFMTKDFRDAVERHILFNPWTECIDRQLAELFRELRARIGNPYEITRKLDIERLWEKRDAAETIVKILNLSSEEASETFKGLLTRKTTCSACNSESDSDVEFLSLPLSLKPIPIVKQYSVESGIAEYFKTLHFTGENQMFCRFCNAKSNATTKCGVKRPPDVLMLQLKRVEFDQRRRVFVKNNCSVIVPLTVKIPGPPDSDEAGDQKKDSGKKSDKKKDGEKKKEDTYEAYAIVKHCGDLKGGHNLALIKSEDHVPPGQQPVINLWYKFDNTTVSMIPSPFLLNFMTSRSAYLLFYKRKEEKSSSSSSSSSDSEDETPEPVPVPVPVSVPVRVLVIRLILHGILEGVKVLCLTLEELQRMKVRDLKQKFREMSPEIEMQNIDLICQDQRLDNDNAPLCQYQIQNNSHIHMVMQVPGGPPA